MTHLLSGYCSLSFLPATTGTTEIRAHSQACRARHGGARTLSKTTEASRDCVWRKHILLIRDLKSQCNGIELNDQTCYTFRACRFSFAAQPLLASQD